MSADPSAETHRAPIGNLGECLYFGPVEARLFGWLHRPQAAARTDLGLVICPPFGYEAICSHRAARSLAEAAAAMGVPALRFDYRGTGDSAEIEPEADQIDAWSQDVLSAIAELQRHTGVTRICLLGFRLGGLLAALSASQCKAVQSLVLIAPVISGRRYLRELRTMRLAGLLRSSSDDSSGSAASDDAKTAQALPLEVAGFSLSPATLAALEKIDMAKIMLSPRCDVLVIDGASMPVARGWAEEQSRLGRRTQYLALPKVIELMITAPQYALASPPMLTATAEWLAQYLDRSAPADHDRSPVIDARPMSSAGFLSLSAPAHSPSTTLTERPVFFGSEVSLFGIVTEPVQGEKRRRAVILLNAGADHHVGPSRVHIALARRWARSGYFVLRMDLAGLGDSGTRPASPEDDAFPPAALEDIRAGIDFLKARYGIRDITLAGVCSGAYHALRAAVAGLSVGRILMVNPQNYFWTQKDMQLAEVIQNPIVYRQRVLSREAWKRLFSGEVSPWRIARIYGRRAILPLESMLRDLARRLRIHLSDDLGRELEDIALRGVRIVFVFAEGEPGLDLLKLEAGSSVKRLGSRCRVRIIERGDHVFSESGPRATLEDILTEELFARTDFGAVPGAPTGR